MIWAAKTYGIKAVNPGGVAAWKWGKNANQLHEPIEGYKNITAAQIIAAARADRRRARTAASDAPPPEQPRRARQRHLDDRNDEGPARATARIWRTCSSMPTAATTGAR